MTLSSDTKMTLGKKRLSTTDLQYPYKAKLLCWKYSSCTYGKLKLYLRVEYEVNAYSKRAADVADCWVARRGTSWVRSGGGARGDRPGARCGARSRRGPTRRHARSRGATRERLLADRQVQAVRVRVRRLARERLERRRARRRLEAVRTRSPRRTADAAAARGARGTRWSTPASLSLRQTSNTVRVQYEYVTSSSKQYYPYLSIRVLLRKSTISPYH